MKKKIAYLIFQPAPSSVVRAEVFKDIILKKGFDVDYVYLFSLRVAAIEGKSKNSLFKLFLRGMQRVIRYVSVELVKNKLSAYDGIVILKYISPGMMSTLKRGIKGKMLYDFDDAVWLPVWLGETAFEKIVGSVDFVSCDNHYLKAKADKYNSNTFVLNGPSQIELFDSHESTKGDSKEIVIGWIGSPSTLFYLDLISEALEEIGFRYPNVCLHLVGTGSKSLNFKKIKTKLFPTYDQQGMVKHVKNFDIGLYPIDNDEVSLGRGSLKATIYMAGKVPAVCSAYGENCNIIVHGKNGFLATVKKEWISCLETLIKDSDLRRKVGISGYEYAKYNLDIESCYRQLYDNYLSKI